MAFFRLAVMSKEKIPRSHKIENIKNIDLFARFATLNDIF